MYKFWVEYLVFFLVKVEYLVYGPLLNHKEGGPKHGLNWVKEDGMKGSK